MTELLWQGKEKVKNHHKEVAFHLLQKEYEFHSEDRANSQDNLLIHGDNLLALKSLLPQFAGKVNCIYIDPPYNTGNENWVYNDNVNDPKIQKWLGEVVGKEGEDFSRHDKWLCMMFPRLKLLKELLAENGVIFISIDDNEQANLKIICDEIFGISNFIATVSVINNPKGRSDKENIATAHEYLHIYSKSKNVNLRGFEAGEHITKRYNKVDENGKKWREIDLRKTGDNDLRTDRPNMFYPFYFDEKNNVLSLEKIENAIEILPMKDSETDGRWRWGFDTAKEKLANLYARYMPNKKQWSVFEKDYFDENDLIKSTSVWDFKDVNSERGTEVFVKELGFNKNDFPNPKPLGTIQRVLQLTTDKNSLILDSFSGSGTTAHAVLSLNKQDGGNRKFICIEMEDYAEQITAERIRRVIKGYGKKAETLNGTGGGFSFYKVAEPLFINEDELNPQAPITAIREYVGYTEGLSEIYNSNNPISPHALGYQNNTIYIFYYLEKQITTLDLTFLESIKLNNLRPQNWIIYADTLSLSEEQLKNLGIIFKKIPRDISKF